MNPGIFREYDIRGVAGKDFTEADAVHIGMAYGTLLQKHGNKMITVGRDCRNTSESYSGKFIQGIIDTGCDVIDIGICPTPVLYFSIHHFNVQGGAMVTASHNPPEYNGFKLMNGFESIHSQGLQDIADIIEKGHFAKGRGRLETKDALTPYIEYFKKNISVSRNIKTGVDAGNGTGGITALPVLEALGCTVHDLYCDMDGSFPNHEADPTVKANMEDLIALVREKGLDLGVGYDGDGDRIGVVDETGKIIYGDQLMIIFVREILSRKPGAAFISEVKCSMVMYNEIEKRGGRAVMWRTGHSLIKKKMKEENAELAGEMSGHIFFKDRFFGFDDALYATCRLLEIIADTGKTVSELLSGLPQTFTTPEIRVECPDNEKFAVVEKITSLFKSRQQVIDIDGMRAVYDDGWGLVRASNTQPALVLRFEALTETRLEEIKNEVETALKEIISNAE
ncbi:MAG: phosphomannomutase/phosphoglucomutase [Thermodesulfobacteriota bacterium]|nr:phosphomannomutase/phosphoglucomutase [Thermodesulfobacteriota bacterium]